MHVRSPAAAEPSVTADGSTIRELFGPVVGAGEQQSLAEATLEPGQSTERHFHAASEEIYVVLDGEGDMELDGERRSIHPGDAVLIPPGTWHQVRAAGAGPLRFLCCCAPPYRHEDTFFS